MRARATTLVFFILPTAVIGCAHDPAATKPQHYEGPIIDPHVHVERQARSITPGQDATLPTVDRILSEAHLGGAALVTIARKGQIDVTRAQNDELAGALRKEPRRFFAFGSVHPDDGDEALAELDRMSRMGVRGLKLHPNTQHLDVAAPSVSRVVGKAAELKMVVLFDGYSPFDADETGKFIKLAISHPDARMILAHMGGPRFLDMLAFYVLNMYPAVYRRNVWFDLSAVSHMVAGSPSLSEQLRHTCRLVGVDRILFGSDFPLVVPTQGISDVRAIGFTADEERRIFHDNAAELLGFPGTR